MEQKIDYFCLKGTIPGFLISFFVKQLLLVPIGAPGNDFLI
jgi:hypothetical protein